MRPHATAGMGRQHLMQNAWICSAPPTCGTWEGWGRLLQSPASVWRALPNPHSHWND